MVEPSPTALDVSRLESLIAAVADGKFDELDAAADQWIASAGVQRMSNAIASVFEGYAPQEIMDRFRQKVTDLMQQAYVEGAGSALMQPGFPALLAALRRGAGMEEENARLRADCKALADSEVVANCESCGAWLMPDDDYVTTPEDGISGCWSGITDLPSKRERPCYAYRVGKCEARAAVGEVGR